MINITDQAATKLKQLMETQEQPNLFLRLFITQGGCEGFSYGMGFDAEQKADDELFERGGVKLLVDPHSYNLLRGAQIDYVKSNFGEGFAVRNPNAVTTCGCGHSFKTRQEAGQPEPCGDETPTQA